MKHVYKDQNITLRNMRMIHFDPGHDLPTLIENFAKAPKLIDLQDRTLMARVIGLLTARKDKPTTILMGVKELGVLTAVLVHLFGNHSAGKKTLLSLPPQPSVSDQLMVTDLLVQLTQENIAESVPELVARAGKTSDFLIALLSISDKDEVRSVMDMLAAGRPGVLLMKGYGMLAVSSHHEYCRDRGLRIVQQADGSAELFNLAI